MKEEKTIVHGNPRPETWIEKTINKRTLNDCLDPVIFKERKQRWWAATETLRKQKLYIFEQFGKQTVAKSADGVVVLTIELPEVMRDMVEYVDEQIEEAAREIIGQGAATHFDPDIVKSFLKCEQEFVSLREKYRD